MHSFKPYAYAAIAILVAACSIARPSKNIAEYSISDFLANSRYYSASFSPHSEKILITSDQSGVLNAFAIEVSSGNSEQLTHSESDSILTIGYFPNDQRIMFLRDQGGNELDHVYVLEKDGTETDLTPGEGFKAQFGAWTQDDRSFFILTSERDERFFDLYEYSVDGYARELLYRNNAGFDIGPISPNRRYMALRKTVTNAKSEIYIHDFKIDKTRLITEFEEDANNFPVGFSSDSLNFYYKTDRDTQFLHLARHSLETGEHTNVLNPEWDIGAVALSKYGKYIVVEVNVNSASELRIYSLPDFTFIPIPQLPHSVISNIAISSDENLVAFYVSNGQTPNDLYMLDLEQGSLRKLAESVNANIVAGDLVNGEVVWFTSYDGVEVPGVLYKPHGVSTAKKVPAMIYVHGGPGGQSKVQYQGLLQFLVNHGYVVYAINTRGSDGYGKNFIHLDDRKHGSADLDDCVASKQMLIDTGYVDPAKIGIIGASYGGYIVLAALTFRPKEFVVGVDMYGISNWYRTVNSIPAWREGFRNYMKHELGPVEDEEFFKAKSPFFHAESIERPLLVIQGANDPRVRRAESDEIVNAVRNNGIPVEYIVFDDEGHGIEKKANEMVVFKSVLAFLDNHVNGLVE